MQDFRGLNIDIANQQHFAAVQMIRRTVLPESHAYHYENNIGIPDVLSLVATLEGRVVGFITVLTRTWNPNGRALWERVNPYVGFLGVTPELQRHGIGQRLIKAASQILLAAGKATLYLECDAELIPVYCKYGFSSVIPEQCEMLFGMRSSSNLMQLEIKQSVS